MGDAQALPYEDASFDAAYLITVLGEIPAPDVALAELRRVLKPAGRLVVGEMALDPDYVPLRTLKREAAAAGLTFASVSGSALAYLASSGRPRLPARVPLDPLVGRGCKNALQAIRNRSSEPRCPSPSACSRPSCCWPCSPRP